MKKVKAVSRPSRTRGRPCLLTPKRLKKFLAAIKDSMPLKHAAAFAGVSYDTVNRWRIKGEQGDAPIEFRHFCKALARAQAVAMSRLLGRVQKAGSRDWRAAAWLLERRHSEDFAKASDVDLRGLTKASPPPSPWDGHPVKREIAETEEVRGCMKKLAHRLSEIMTNRDWAALRDEDRVQKADFGRTDWSVKRLG